LIELKYTACDWLWTFLYIMCAVWVVGYIYPKTTNEQDSFCWCPFIPSGHRYLPHVFVAVFTLHQSYGSVARSSTDDALCHFLALWPHVNFSTFHSVLPCAQLKLLYHHLHPATSVLSIPALYLHPKNFLSPFIILYVPPNLIFWMSSLQ
jgi:hypothetical protein